MGAYSLVITVFHRWPCGPPLRSNPASPSGSAHVYTNITIQSYSFYHLCMRGSRLLKALSEASKFDNVFLVDEGKEDPNTAINRHHRPASETPLLAFRWRADDGPTLNAGLVAL